MLAFADTYAYYFSTALFKYTFKMNCLNCLSLCMRETQLACKIRVC